MSMKLEQLADKVRNAVVADPETGRYQCDRGIFTDKDLFELEMKYILTGVRVAPDMPE
jgi:benzoate/toluate 1,2-dioxygenase alpha subunit